MPKNLKYLINESTPIPNYVDNEVAYKDDEIDA